MEYHEQPRFFIAYLNEADPLQENYRVLRKDNYYYELLIKSPYVTVKPVPDPRVIEFDTVYYPRLIGYRKSFIREVEPLFSNDKGSFIRFYYWAEGFAPEEFGVDIFLTKKGAFLGSLRYLWLNIRTQLRNYFKSDTYLEKILKKH